MTFEQKDPLELDYVPEKVRDTKKLASRFSKIMLWMIGGFVIFFIFWASFFSMNEVTRGQGKVIASQETQIIDTLESGIIHEIHVKEGQLVNPGDVMISIDKTIVGAEYEGSHTQYLNYIAAQARLKAQIEGKDFVVPEVVTKQAPEIAAQEMSDYHERLHQLKNQIEIADDQIAQKQQEIAEAQSQIDHGKETLGLLKEELDLVTPLVKEELISKRDVLRLKRDIQETEGKVQTAEIDIPKLKAALLEAENKKEQIGYEFKVQDADKLQDIEAKLADAQSRMKTAENKLSRTEIKAPLKGIVKDIKVKTIGSAIQSGQDLIEVEPAEDTLLVETKVAPTDVAFIRPGMKAIFKVSAYDYSIYGGLDAEVVDISADTLEDKTTNPPQSYYRVNLRTKTNHLTHEGKDLPIIPGENGEVNIVTGEHTIMKFLLKPIIKGLNRAFGER
ncbi:HlyD family type I secretion protein [Candidatus Bealeia paramacronuclearis]|uniref:Membrane fusion protein (MFP) family protein n=1 Tax=Candidatus Bealeia paramacronuclearis TaxID=1921001 RepID=A0ABZ2C1J3_9PROT|nr:HlyD family type I secretion protein [Candidatus Bealeia paramacronuclearis]